MSESKKRNRKSAKGPDPRFRGLQKALSRMPGDPAPRTELRYSFSGDDRMIVELFRTVCNLSSRDSKRILIMLIEEWTLKEAAHLNLDISNIIE